MKISALCKNPQEESKLPQNQGLG